MPAVLASLSTVIGFKASLLMLVMLLASAPNSTPAQAATIKWLMLSVAAACVLGLVGGVGSIIAGRPWLGAGLGAVPTVYVVGLVVVLLVVQR
jgi:hypothetical protein